MLKRNKAVSIVMALCLCLAMLAPVFVAPQSAEASATYEVISAPTVSNSGTANLGVIKVTIPDTSLFNYDYVTVELPTDVTFTGDVSIDTYAHDSGITIVAPGTSGTDYLATTDFYDSSDAQVSSYQIKNNEFNIYLKPGKDNQGADKYFYIYFKGADLNNTTGDITVSFNAPSDSAFSSSDALVIAKSSSSKSTTTSIKSVDNISDRDASQNKIEPITVQEDIAGSINFYKPITLEILTDGYTWGSNGTAAYGWSLSTSGNATMATTSNDQKIQVTPGSGITPNEKGNYYTPTSPAKITVSGLTIDVDDTKAKVGDEVQVKVSGADMDSATLTVAKYSDYSATVEEGTTKTLIAGQKDQDIGEFYIEEGAPGSLDVYKTINLTLPSGAEWVTDAEKTAGETGNYGNTEITNNSSIGVDVGTVSGDNNETLKWKVTKDSSGAKNGAKIGFKDMQVCVSPAFSGDLNITVTGSAGVTGTVKVGTVVPAVTITPGEITNVILGKPDQKINDLTVTEGTDGALLEDKDLTLKLDDGYTWASTPTVKVTTGDLDIDDANIATSDQTLTIPITGDSNTASTITISDIAITADRTAPEGPITLKIGKGADTATNEIADYSDKTPNKAVIANCVTAAVTSGSNVFTIGSNVFECNGTKMVMDVAPYIKSSRTYVPMRYLAEMVGADVAWDATAQTVTLTKGSTVVVFTIGSNAYTINGAAQTADVAPEIVNSRTFLPARFVAEAFGYQAGWDASTNTVVISE